MIVAIAKDEAFNFTYRANIDDLSKLGEVVFFSPLHDAHLPQCDLLYLPGGYPELYLDQLGKNLLMKQSINQFAEMGGMVFAECGGFMYLCKQIDQHEMCGVFPMVATMQNAHLHLGYRKMRFAGLELKGHEFHYSELVPTELPDTIKVLREQFSASGEKVDTALYSYKNVLAGYTHWYWAENGFNTTWLKKLTANE